ncbi:MAG: hypothetical protein IKP81_06190 [Paludibacteraceae bacterium]|nr:hypothetical protein [Paludibacteraceae bacterium]
MKNTLTIGILQIICISTSLLASCGNEEESPTEIQKDELSTKEQGVSINGIVEGHTFVDLGLKSGTLWATHNVGATKPSEYGHYFAWGETQQKEDYDWKTYKWCNNVYENMTKYCLDSTCAIIDSLTSLEPNDDAATVLWGKKWRMPSREEQIELLDECNWEWVEDFNNTGVKGHLGTSKINKRTIFLPASGIFIVTMVNGINESAGYWSSTLYPPTKLMKNSQAYSINIGIAFDPSILVNHSNRYGGQSIRAVVSGNK